MRESQGWTRARIPFVALLASVLLIGLPASALAAAQMRFMHAVPGAPAVEARVSHDGKRVVLGRSVGYGQHTAYHRVPGGTDRVAIFAGGKQVMALRIDIKSGRHYTWLALPKGKAIMFKDLPDGRPQPGIARFRMFHAAFELGAADIKFGQREFARDVKYGQVTPYHRTRPGSYELAAMKPGGSGAPLLQGKVALAAGTATTAYVIGSRGKEVRVVLASDGTAAPSTAPATGLGGLADRQVPWLLVLAAAALAAAVGGGLHRARRGGGRDGGP